MPYFVCATDCGDWYSTTPPYLIEFLYLMNVPGICVNMIEVDFIQLCQDFKAVEIGKIYQYTFDMGCFPAPFIDNCSAWVILNG